MPRRTLSDGIGARRPSRALTFDATSVTDARVGPRPRALGVRGSDADARRPIDPGQGARRTHGTAFGRLDATRVRDTHLRDMREVGRRREFEDELPARSIA